MESKRKSFIDCAVETAKVWSQRSEDPFRKVGACIINSNGRVLSVGYNGLPSKFLTGEGFWQDREKRRMYMIHAEVNALSILKLRDDPYLIATTLLPCSSCASLIAAHGIKEVVYLEEYNLDKRSLDIFNLFGINVYKYEP